MSESVFESVSDIQPAIPSSHIRDDGGENDSRPIPPNPDPNRKRKKSPDWSIQTERESKTDRKQTHIKKINPPRSSHPHPIETRFGTSAGFENGWVRGL